MNNYSTVCLLGASFSTGNLGVSALAWSSIKLIKQKSPSATICIIGGGREISNTQIEINGETINIAIYPVRYTPKLWAENHIVGLYFKILIVKLFPSLKGYFKKNNTLGIMLTSDLFCDITGGDSFSDIYGLTRFFKAFLLKRASQLTTRPFVMLPQTYGPFKSKICQVLARAILKKSTVILSRDKEGVQAINSLLGKTKKIKLCPDVAFLLDPVAFDYPLLPKIQVLKKQGKEIIGLNISGLLYSGGYTGNNEFGLAVNYQQLIHHIIKSFVAKGLTILLIPHVFSENKLAIESDVNASQRVYDSFSLEIQQQLLFSEQVLDQSEAKYLIGHCDFFMGARMHSCIAALSQSIPTIGMAYSKKFAGVFETVGVISNVINMTKVDNNVAITMIDSLYQQRETTRQKLMSTIPVAKQQVSESFNSW